MHLYLNVDKEWVLLIKLIRTQMDDRLVITTGIQHKDVTTSNMNKRLRDPIPNPGIGLEMTLDRLDRGLNIILQNRDRIFRDCGLDQFLGQPGFEQSTDHVRLGVAMRSKMGNLF